MTSEASMRYFTYPTVTDTLGGSRCVFRFYKSFFFFPSFNSSPDLYSSAALDPRHFRALMQKRKHAQIPGIVQNLPECPGLQHQGRLSCLISLMIIYLMRSKNKNLLHWDIFHFVFETILLIYRHRIRFPHSRSFLILQGVYWPSAMY